MRETRYLIKFEKELTEKLEEGGISGSAVLPNPDAYPEWTQKVSAIREELKQKIQNF